MYNTDRPARAELPTSAQLRRSTLIAALAASVILVTVVLPSEYAIDPTRIGRLMGLTQMGEIKAQLAEEAAGDAAAAAAPAGIDAAGTDVMRRLDRIEALLTAQPQQGRATPEPAGSLEPVATAAPAPTVQAAANPAAAKPAAGRADELSFTLAPGQGAEIKLVMRQGARAGFAWASSGGPVNFDTHGDAPGQSTSYNKGRGVESDEGFLEAAFDGNHGWFWRNRGRADVTVTLRTNGDYAEIKRIL